MYVCMYVWSSVPQPPPTNGDGCSVLVLKVPAPPPLVACGGGGRSPPSPALWPVVRVCGGRPPPPGGGGVYVYMINMLQIYLCIYKNIYIRYVCIYVQSTIFKYIYHLNKNDI